MCREHGALQYAQLKCHVTRQHVKQQIGSMLLASGRKVEVTKFDAMCIEKYTGPRYIREENK